MTKYFFLPVVMLAAFASSCKKDENASTPHPAKATNYMPMKVGNYWVYERYRVDSNGNEHLQTGGTDSCYIRDTKVVRGNTYFGYYSQMFGSTSYQRDSAGCMVQDDGKILFTLNQPGIRIDKFSANDGNGNPVLDSKTISWPAFRQISVPAGSFICCGYTQHLDLYPPFNNKLNSWEGQVCYGKGVGLVMRELAWLSQLSANKEFERNKLVRYHLN